MQISCGSESFKLSDIASATVPSPTAGLEKLSSDFRSQHPDAPRESRINGTAQWMKILHDAGAHSQGGRRMTTRGLFIASVAAALVVAGLLAGAIVLAVAR
jgi:hypothetical protein